MLVRYFYISSLPGLEADKQPHQGISDSNSAFFILSGIFYLYPLVLNMTKKL